MKRSAEETLLRAEASRIAGAKGRSAAPIPAQQRLNALLHESLTPKQRRRANKKIDHQRPSAQMVGAR